MERTGPTNFDLWLCSCKGRARDQQQGSSNRNRYGSHRTSPFSSTRLHESYVWRSRRRWPDENGSSSSQLVVDEAISTMMPYTKSKST